MRRGTKRALSFMLATAMGFAVLSGAKGGPGVNEVLADSVFGFKISAPANFDENDGENPYGNGIQTFNVKSEAFIWRQDGSQLNASTYNYTASDQLSGKKFGILGDSYKKVTSLSRGSGEYRYVSTKAYDPYGNGRDNMVAMVGCDYGKHSDLTVARYNAAGSGSKSVNFSLAKDSGQEDDWLDSVPQWAYTNFFTLTTGDFNGDGKDEIAVYVPRGKDPYISILDGNTLEEKKWIYLEDFLGKTGANLSTEMHVDSSTARCTPQISMDAADIDRDGVEDLVIVGSYADIVNDSDGNKLKERSSVVACYKGTETLLNSHNELSGAFMSETLNQKNTGKYFRTASVAAGDIDFDGFPEIVVAGNFSSTDEADKSEEALDSLNNTEYAIKTFDYSPGSKKITGGDTATVTMNELTNDGFYSSDDIQHCPALTCVKANGMNAAEEIFLAGSFYSYTAGKWAEDHKTKYCSESDNGIRGYTITNTWVDQCVAGNFDENNLGIEQVLFTIGYKQTATQDYFYRLNISGKNTKTEDKITEANEWYDSDNDDTYAVYHAGKGSKPSVALAAVDIDQDTDTFVYARKEFTCSNVQVAAILQAAPYFEDIKDEYNDLGGVSFGHTEGTGDSTTRKTTAQAGAYVAFEIGSSALKFQSEASFTHEWEWEYEDETTQEFVFEFSASEKNSVVLYSTPAILYHYTVYPADGSDSYDMVIAIQGNPSYMVMEVDEYNAKAKTVDYLKDKLITEEVISNIEGRPDTYPYSQAGLKNYVGKNETTLVSNKLGNSNTADFEINTQSTHTESQSYTNSFEVKLGFEAGAEDPLGVVEVSFSAGVSVGGGWGAGSTTINYSGISKTATIGYPPATESEYGFNARFGTWPVKLGNSEVPVLGFIVTDIEMPPSPPRNLAIDTVTDHSITVEWEIGSKKADYYEIYQVFDDGITDNPYSLLDTVTGDETTYTFDNLDPATTYSLAMRARSKEGSKPKISEYTNTVTATTLSKGDAPLIAKITKEQNVIVGDTATFTVEASPSSGVNSGLAYSWQMRESGKSNWIKLGKSSTSSSFVIENVTKEMDGNQYRCVVSEIHNGDRRYCYSDSGTLHVGKADTVTTVTALNAETDQNSGYADETYQEKVPVEVSENKIVKIKIGENENSYEVIENTNDSTKNTIPYIYRGVDDGKIYILKNVNETNGTADSAAEVVHKENYVVVGGVEIYFSDFDLKTIEKAPKEIVPEKKTVDGKNYYIYEKNIYEEEDENNPDKILSIVKTYEIFELIETDPVTSAEIGTDKFYTLKTENNKESMVELSIESDNDGEYRSEDSTIVTLGETVQVINKYSVSQDKVKSGDKVNISLQVTKQSKTATLGDSASVRLLNTNTGDIKLIAAEVDKDGMATVSWIPDKEGKYTITATYSGSNNTKTSSAITTYYAMARQEKDYYVVKANDAIYGGRVSIETFKCIKDENGKIIESALPSGTVATYMVTYNDDSGKIAHKDLGNNDSFYPEIAGIHDIYATINDGNITSNARVLINVSKRPLIAAAPENKSISVDNKEAKKLKAEDISISYKDNENEVAIIEKDIEKYKVEDLFKLSTEPELDEDSGEGTYLLNAGFMDSASDLAKSFQNRYSVIFRSSFLTILSDVFEVNYDSSINGELKGYNGDKKVYFKSGNNIDSGTKVSFTAFPDEGYSVTEWTLTDFSGKDLVPGTDYELINNNEIIIDSLSSNINVHAEFGMNSHVVTFAAEENGNLEANYLNAGNKTSKLVSPEDIAEGKKIIFTAIPDKGYVVKNWSISENGGMATILKNKDGSNYSKETYEVTVKNDLYVTVEFEKEAFYSVDATFISDESVVGATFEYEGRGADGKVKKGQSVTIKANIPDVVIVKEWRINNSRNNGYKVVQGGLDTFTIENVQEDTSIGVVLVGYKTNNLVFKAIDDAGYEVADVITAKSQESVLSSGKDYVAYIPVTFTAKLPTGYTAVKWTVKDVAKNTETIVAKGKDALSYELPTLDKVTQVILYLDKTPQVYYKADNAGGTISSAKYANGAMLTKNSKEDLTFTVNTNRYNKVKEVNVLYGKDKYTSATLSIDSNVLKNNSGTLTVKAPKDGWKKDVNVSIIFEEAKPDLMAHDAETVYAGQPIDVAGSDLGMFGADEKLGRLVYKLENGGSGVGTLSGSSLTVTKVGTFVISLGIVDAAGKEVKTPVKATLTVKKGVGTGLVTATDITVGQNVIVNAESSTNGISNVSYIYKKFGTDTILAKAPSKVGKYTVVATFAANDLYESCVATTDFEIKDKEVDPAKEKKKNSASLNAGAKFTVKKSSAVLKWGKVKGADGYEIYGGECAPKKKLLVTIKSGKTTSYTFKKIAGKKVNGRKMYRMVVKAYKKVNGKKVYIAESLDLHSVGPENPKFTDVKSISVKKTSYNLKVGKTAKISPSRTKTESKKAYLEKWHASTYRYFSTNEDIAKVSKKGVITAKSKGTCYIYVMGVNGAQKKIKVTVK